MAINKPNLSQHIRHVLEALDFIERNLKEKIAVDDVCAQIASSPWHFQRVFRSLVGDSIGSYLRGRRLTEACEVLLTNGSLNVIREPGAKLIDVAFDFQFNSHEAFSRSFKAFFGFNPSEIETHRGQYALKRKVALDGGKMQLIWCASDREYQVTELGPFSLLGIVRRVSSPFSNDDEFESETFGVWTEFHRVGKAVFGQELLTTPSFGVALSTKDQLISDRMDYFACKHFDSVERKKSAGHLSHEELTSIQLPSANYARFSVQGSVRTISTLVDYIYGIWLPNSKFERSKGYDFETFDFARQKENGLVSYTYNLPVKNR